MTVTGITATPGTSATSANDAKEKAEMGAFEAALKKAAESGDTVALKNVCKDFEAIFVQMIMKNMRNTVPDDGLFEKSQAQSIFEGMLDEEFSQKISSAGGFGLSDMLFTQLQKKYGKADAPQQGEGFDAKG